MNRITCFFAIFTIFAGLSASVARAELYTYSYKGNNFSSVSSPYTTSNFITGQFTVDLPSNLNLPVTDITDQIQSFSFSDGQQTITNKSKNVQYHYFIVTNGSGDITNWKITNNTGRLREINTYSAPDYGGSADDEASLIGSKRGSNLDEPGSWSHISSSSSRAEKHCQNAKLRAVTAQYSCLAKAYRLANKGNKKTFEHRIAKCDDRFDRKFERAEADGACRTPGGQQPCVN